MKQLSKNQFTYTSLVPAGKGIHKSFPFTGNDETFLVSFKDGEDIYTAEFTDLYFLNVFQFRNPSQTDMQKAKELILQNADNFDKSIIS